MAFVYHLALVLSLSLLGTLYTLAHLRALKTFYNVHFYKEIGEGEGGRDISFLLICVGAIQDTQDQ